MNKLKLIDQLTTHINKFIPRCAVDLKIEQNCIRYLHPTRGWERVSFKRIGIKHG